MSTTAAVGTSERLGQIVPDALAAIHEVLERHRVTEEEWHAVLRFLTEVGRADEFILLSDVTRTSVLIDAMSHARDESATASDVEGPLYVEDPPWREAPVQDLRGLRGHATTARCCSSAARSPRRTARR